MRLSMAMLRFMPGKARHTDGWSDCMTVFVTAEPGVLKCGPHLRVIVDDPAPITGPTRPHGNRLWEPWDDQVQ